MVTLLFFYLDVFAVQTHFDILVCGGCKHFIPLSRAKPQVIFFLQLCAHIGSEEDSTSFTVMATVTMF